MDDNKDDKVKKNPEAENNKNTNKSKTGVEKENVDTGKEEKNQTSAKKEEKNEQKTKEDGSKKPEDAKSQKTEKDTMDAAKLEENKLKEAKLEEERKLQEEKEKEINENAIKDIIGEDSEKEKEDERDPEAKQRTFSRREMVNRTKFSIGNLDEYLHHRYKYVNSFIRAFIEAIIVFSIFMLFPSLSIIFIARKPLLSVIKSTMSPMAAKDSVTSFTKGNLFIAMIYIIYVTISVFINNSIYIVAYLFRLFDITIDGFPAEFLQVLKSSRRFIRNALVATAVFLLANVFFEKYKFFTMKLTVVHILMTVVIWYAMLSFILFFEKFLINIFTSEIRKSSFQNRIWDANYKTYIFKKLATVAEATPSGKSEVDIIIKTMVNEFDGGLYLRHTDLDLSSKENAKYLAESIFGYLEVEELEYDDIKRIFPDNDVDEIVAYLSGKKKDNYEDTVITFESFCKRAVELYHERQDIKRSLSDRENIINRLDQILIALVVGGSLMVFLFLLGIDYKYYLASVGPFVFGFSWVFKDTIKDLYNCFVFHLISHPYDVGDRVLIDNCEMKVVRVDLLSTVFENMSGRLIYIPNTTLFAKKIDNIRRSSKQYENLFVIVAKETSYDTLEKIRKDLEQKYRDLEEEFTGKVFIRNYMLEGDSMKLIISIEHNSNFQDEPRFYKRRQDCIKILQDVLSSNGIVYDQRFSFVSL